MMATTPRVLIIEDVDDQRELLGEWFRRAGCTVVMAVGTADAESQLGESAPDIDIAVIDLLLSGHDDGWKALQTVRTLSPGAAIVISSVLDVSDFPPADAYLPKPISKAQVQALVDRFVPTR